MNSNPMLNNRVVENVVLESEPMTIQGTINKTLILIGIVVVAGLYTWNLLANGFADKANIIAIASAIVGFILAIFTSFNPKAAKITAPAYAFCEGLLVGAVSYFYNAMFDGIVVQAVSLTLTVLVVMLVLYRTKLIQATETFKRTLFYSLIAITLYYVICAVAHIFFHISTVQTNITNSSPMAIGVSCVICTVAALYFIWDFDNIEKLTQRNMPAYFEWYCGFSLLVTLVWLYFEILKLLARLNSRR